MYLSFIAYCVVLLFEVVWDKRSVKKLDGKGVEMGSVGNTIWSFHGRQLRVVYNSR